MLFRSDEALAVGDAFFTQKCMRFLRRFRETGTLLFVSHDSGAVVNLCDRAIWLQHGELLSLGPAKAVTEQYLASLFETASDAGGSEEAVQPKRTLVHSEDWRDQRQDWINASGLRNDLQVFRFDPEASQSFGQGGARMTGGGFGGCVVALMPHAAVPAVPVVLVVLVPAELELKIQSLALVYIMLPVGGRYMCRCKCSFWR